MNRLFAILGVTGLMVSGLANQGHAAAVVIDDFTQGTVDLSIRFGNAPNPATSTQAVANVLGGERQATLLQLPGGLTSSLIINPPEGKAAYGNLMAESVATLTYDGAGNVGLDETDLTGGGTNEALVARLLAADAGVVLKYTLTDVMDNAFTQTMVTAGAVTNFNVYFALNAFLGVDVTKIKSVVFSIEGGPGEVDADARFNFLGAVSAVPEPSTLAMFAFGGLGLIVAARRRRQVVAV